MNIIHLEISNVANCNECWGMIPIQGRENAYMCAVANMVNGGNIARANKFLATEETSFSPNCEKNGDFRAVGLVLPEV